MLLGAFIFKPLNAGVMASRLVVFATTDFEPPGDSFCFTVSQDGLLADLLGEHAAAQAGDVCGRTCPSVSYPGTFAS